MDLKSGGISSPHLLNTITVFTREKMVTWQQSQKTGCKNFGVCLGKSLGNYSGFCRANGRVKSC